MFEIRTPNPQFTGTRLGIKFRNGLALCNATEASLMARLGYQVSEVTESQKTPQRANVLPSRGISDQPARPRARKPRKEAQE